jgi:hypothetical protein
MNRCTFCRWLGALLAPALVELFIKECQPHRLSIVSQGAAMPDIAPGATDALKVTALNKGGKPVPVPPDTAVTVSKPDDSVSAVDPTSGNFTYTAGASEGSDTLTATGGGLTSPGYVENVVDNVPATLAIAPQ